jgi:uncharacterized protein YbjQ (UPF0145 family)
MQIILFFILLLMGFIWGRIAEKNHYASLERREGELRDIVVLSTKHVPPSAEVVKDPFVTGTVVISHDYYSGVLALIRKLFGGRIVSYERLVERARREAILRLKAGARSRGSRAVYNLRLETASVSKGLSQTIVTVEVFAYGTAVRKIPYENS